MNNLHRELAPISDAAWAQIEEEARRTFKRHLAGAPGGRRDRARAASRLSAVGTGHLARIERPATGSRPGSARSQPLVEFRVPFTLDRQADRRRRARRPGLRLAAGQGRRQADRLRRGPRGLRRLRAAGITGIRQGIQQPADRRCPPTRANYSGRGRPGAQPAAAGRGRRPVLAAAHADAYTAVSERPTTRLSDPRAHQAADRRRHHLGAGHRRRLRAHHPRRRLRPAPRPGPLDRLPRHDATSVQLYFQESLTFLVYTAEASVALQTS